ncbi:hypothetical protein Hbl1158_09960 [Halobaculum sp. CBA1158]|uniref:hypothetical protein n=1 Tax=Halobaculum sp. CBA1158 TaxID=2904243 RepID=UPI001F346484|nr:hypothetical protein [Halobaculum sp. CBA1158]UIO98858.1 hypothetical protein Hbl1158_09960 [Halobaculum sp. CBA1158]
MDLADVREDLIVAGTAALGAVVLAVGVDLLAGIPVSTPARLAPLVVYFAYLFTRKGGPYAAVDTPRNWTVLVVLVTVGAAAYAVFV